MISSAIGLGIGAAGAIYGGFKASEAMNKISNNINQQLKDNQNWFDRNYNEAATQRASAQELLNRTEESIKKRNRQAAATAAVMGGTNESVAAEKAANSEEYANATRQIMAQDDARKDNIMKQYMQTKDNLNAQMNDLEAKKAEAIAQATQGLTSAAGGMI